MDFVGLLVGYSNITELRGISNSFTALSKHRFIFLPRQSMVGTLWYMKSLVTC